MASNGIGRGYPRGGRTPQFLTFGLLVVICILAFNYWNVSSRSKLLQKQVQEMTGTLEELAMKKVHLEKRSEALQSQIADANHANTNLRQQKETCDKEAELTKRENSDIAERLQSAVNDKTALLETLEKEKLNATNTIRLLTDIKEQYEKLKMTHEVLQKNTLSEKDRMITELNEQQEILTNNLRTVSQEKDQLESMVQGYKTQLERLQLQNQQCQQQLQIVELAFNNSIDQENKNGRLAMNLQDCEDDILERTNKIQQLQVEILRLKEEVSIFQEQAVQQDKVAAALQQCTEDNDYLEEQLNQTGAKDDDECKCQSEQDAIAELRAEADLVKAQKSACEAMLKENFYTGQRGGAQQQQQQQAYQNRWQQQGGQGLQQQQQQQYNQQQQAADPQQQQRLYQLMQERQQQLAAQQGGQQQANQRLQYQQNYQQQQQQQQPPFGGQQPNVGLQQGAQQNNEIFQQQQQQLSDSQQQKQENFLEEKEQGQEGDGNEEPAKNEDPGIPNMEVEDQDQQQQGDNQENNGPDQDEDGGHGGENDGHDQDDGVAQEQKEFFEREQEREEEMRKDDDEEIDREQVGQIEIPRDEDGEDVEGQDMGAQVHAPGDVQYGDTINDEEDEGPEGDDTQNEGGDHIPLMGETNIDGDNGQPSLVQNQDGDSYSQDGEDKGQDSPDFNGNDNVEDEEGDNELENSREVANHLREQYDMANAVDQNNSNGNYQGNNDDDDDEGDDEEEDGENLRQHYNGV